MSKKVDDATFKRIIQLRNPPYSLTLPVISERLGISERTIRIYLRAHRLGEKPYQKSGALSTTPESSNPA